MGGGRGATESERKRREGQRENGIDREKEMVRRKGRDGRNE